MGVTYTGFPLSLEGEKRSADGGLSMPKLTVGQPNVDLSIFKPMIYDGWLDNAVIVRQIVLLANLTANVNVKETRTYRVKRVEQYSRSQVTLQLATLSDSLGFRMPYRQYLPPAFPTVKI
jgi:phage-related protein